MCGDPQLVVPAEVFRERNTQSRERERKREGLALVFIYAQTQTSHLIFIRERNKNREKKNTLYSSPQSPTWTVKSKLRASNLSDLNSLNLYFGWVEEEEIDIWTLPSSMVSQICRSIIGLFAVFFDWFIFLTDLFVQVKSVQFRVCFWLRYIIFHLNIDCSAYLQMLDSFLEFGDSIVSQM